MIPSTLAERIALIPELYQPIFNHPEFPGSPSRGCEDRLQYLQALHDTLREKLGRPIRILDLGCAQGFFSMSLASRGAVVVGVDFLDLNVNVCTMLAEEHPELDVRFQHARVEEVIEQAEANSYDIVLGLSVFHHICHEHGQVRVIEWLTKLAEVSIFCAFELALADEPLYWAASLPADETALLAGFAFKHCIARFPTHLSTHARPLYVASSRYWYLSGELETFSEYSDESHAFAIGTHQGSRRYFFGETKLAKLFSILGPRGELNKTEITSEAAFLLNAPEAMAWPRLYVHAANESQAWLTRERLPGKLLSEVIVEGLSFDVNRVLRDVLNQLVALETAQLYHSDVRTWNILLDPEGAAHLIDFGAISPLATDCVWPSDLILSFIILVHEVVSRDIGMVLPTRQPFISPFNFPQPYRRWLEKTWDLPRDDWSYRVLRDSFVEYIETASQTGGVSNVSTSALDVWMRAVEHQLFAVGKFVGDSQGKELSSLLQNLHARLQDDLANSHQLAQQRVDGLHAVIEELRGLTISQFEVSLVHLRDDLAKSRQSTERRVDELFAAVEELRALNKSQLDLSLAQQKMAMRQVSIDIESRTKLQNALVANARQEGALHENREWAQKYERDITQIFLRLDQITAKLDPPAQIVQEETKVQPPTRGLLRRASRRLALKMLSNIAARPRLLSNIRRLIARMPAPLRRHFSAFARNSIAKGEVVVANDPTQPFLPTEVTIHRPEPSLSNQGTEVVRVAGKLEQAIHAWKADRER